LIFKHVDSYQQSPFPHSALCLANGPYFIIMEKSMKNRTLGNGFIFFMLAVLCMSIFFGCSRDKFFKQPKLRIISAELLELPAELTKLQVTAKVINQDRKAATVKKITYTVRFTDDNITSEQMQYEENIEIGGMDNVTQTFPLTIKTAGAVKLLKKLEQGQTLAYEVTGEFVIENALVGTITLPFSVAGEALVEIGYESFFQQPLVAVNNYAVKHINFSGLPLPLPVSVDMTADITVTNLSVYGATISEVEYLVKVNGIAAVQSETYGDDAAEPELTLGPFDNDAGNPSDTEILAAMPFTMPASVATLFIGKSGQNVSVNYEVIGTFTATATIGLEEIEFNLPLNVAGTTMVAVP